MNSKNIDAAIKAVKAEQGAEVAAEDLDAYLAKIGELSAAVAALKEPHRKVIRAAQSRASQAKRKAKIEAALAMYEAAQKTA